MKKPMASVPSMRKDTRRPNKEINPDFLPLPCPALKKENVPYVLVKGLLPLLAKVDQETKTKRERMIVHAMSSNDQRGKTMSGTCLEGETVLPDA